jgi:putative membrane protein
MKTMSSERRLHPLSIVFDAGRNLPGLVVPMAVLFFATSQRGAAMFILGWVASLTGILLILSVVRYLRFTYRYDARELVIRSGLFTRNERKIPYARIQNLDGAQNVLQRLLGVMVVYVQTGGGAEPEATLRVLPAAALSEMRARVLEAGGRTRGQADAAAPQDRVAEEAVPLTAEPGAATPDAAAAARANAGTAEDTPARTLLALEPGQLVLAGFIENRGMVLIAGALALLEQVGATERIVERLFETENAALADFAARWLGGTEVPVLRGVLYVGVALLGFLLFIRLLSTVWAMVRLYGFRLDRSGDELRTEYGLFTRVSATIPLRRIQTVIVRDGVLHRLLGRRIVSVETAGGAVMDRGSLQREPIAPILREEQLPTLLHELQPGLNLHGIHWQPVHRRAFGRMVRASLVLPVVVSIAAFFVVQEWAIAVFALLVAVGVVHARLRSRNLAWSLTADSIIVRDGALTRVTRIARFSRVQVPAVARNPFDIRLGMARVRADTAGARGGVVIPYMSADAAAAVHDELVARTAETAFTW